MRPKTILSLVGAAAALGTGGIAATGAIADSSSTAPSPSVHAAKLVRNIEGPIVAINRAAGTFTVADREHRNTLSTVKVTPSTRFDNLAGFGALRNGQRVEVKAVPSNGALTATKVERGGRANSGSHDVNDNRRGSRAFEAGDDRGGDRAAEVGDDRGGDRAAEVGDDRGGDRAAEARDDRGHDGRGHDRGDDRGHRGHHGHDG